MFANLCSAINTREINKIFSRDGITCKICLFFGVGANERCSYANFRSLTLISGEFRLRWGIFALFCVLIFGGKKWLVLIAKKSTVLSSSICSKCQKYPTENVCVISVKLLDVRLTFRGGKLFFWIDVSSWKYYPIFGIKYLSHETG